MRDMVKRYVDAGRDAVGGERVEDLARDLLDWSRRNAERLTGLVRREVQRQLRIAGAATREELSELRKRVRTLEREVGVTPRSTPAGGRRSPAKRSGAKKSSAKKSPRKKAVAKTTPPKKTAGRVTPG